MQAGGRHGGGGGEQQCLQGALGGGGEDVQAGGRHGSGGGGKQCLQIELELAGYYRVFHDTGHPKIWLSPRPFIKSGVQIMFIKGLGLAGVQCRETPCIYQPTKCCNTVYQPACYKGGCLGSWPGLGGKLKPPIVTLCGQGPTVLRHARVARGGGSIAPTFE